MAREAGAIRWADPSLLVLHSLAGGPKHGYAIIVDVESSSGVALGPGTLYASLSRLEEAGMIEPLPADDRRRPYKLTATGAAELAQRVDAMERFARSGRRRLVRLDGAPS